MIFLIAAAALCMGGIVAYLAREKGRSPLTWAIYGTVAAPIALPHILIVKPTGDGDDDVWAEIRDAIQNQSVNDQRPIMSRSGTRTEPQAAPRREAPLRQTPAPSVTREAASADLNPAPKPDIKWELKPETWGPKPEPFASEMRAEPRYEPNAEPRPEPKADMFADKRTPATPTNRAEPSFGPATPAPNQARAANDFMLNASDRIGAPHAAAPSAAASGDMRMRAPLSIDPNAERAESRPIAGRLFALGAVAVAVAAGFFVLGPTLAKLVPPELAFWAKPEVKEVKNTAPALTPFDALPNGTSNAPGAAPNDALPGGNVSGAKEVGEAKFGGPIKSDTKAPAYQGSGAAPVDLGMATKGMKPVDVPDEPKAAPPAAKAEAPKATPKSETKSAAVTPAPAPKAEPKAVAAPPAPTPAPAPKAETKAAAATPVPAAPKAEAPKAAAPAAPKPAAAPPEDFLSMVNKAIGTGSAPKPAASASDAEKVEQVSAANDLVQSVQVKLRERGYDPGSIDGRTNPKTVQAIRDYQQSVGMTPDGLIDVALMERLGVVGKRLQFPGGR